MELNKDSLENALNSSLEKKQETPQMPQVSKEQEIGHHQGALTTLINERNELIKMIQNVEAVMQAHIKRLEELGVKIQAQK
ncbi:MAG: hypothetical protein OQK82_00450 [Candidatus Pacearchaeota archaeon]|nr:hypothetical protein [Candidatus Pacearchaeota archaeon]